MPDCGAGTLANELKDELLAGEVVTLPVIDITGEEYEIPSSGSDPIFADIERLVNTDLTERRVDGNGTFDALMQGFNVHLTREYENNRITGEQYTKAYTALVEGAMSNAVAFLLGKDQAFWQAVTAQQQARLTEIQAVIARVGLQKAKIELAMVRIQARNEEANYALTKMRLATESVQYCTAKYQLEELLPQQKLLVAQQIRVTTEAADLAVLNRTEMFPQQVELLTMQIDQLEKQTLMVEAQTDTVEYTNTNLLPKQVLQLEAQTDMVREQIEAQRAQTTNTRTDGLPVTGVLGMQKDLYSQQITSYQRDSEIKAARPFIDAWITMKTIDEGIEPPTGFTNANLDQILATLKSNNDL
jgi:hypothetical protein